jgi:hypothetical protein
MRLVARYDTEVVQNLSEESGERPRNKDVQAFPLRHRYLKPLLIP